jgi:DNA-directed RNA polymerase subunit beta
MPHTIQVGKTQRRSYAKIPEVLELPDLVEVQKRSYDEFLQRDVPAEDRVNIGLEAAFREMLHITDFSETASISYISYELGRPKYDIVECQERGMTYAIPLKVKVQMSVRRKPAEGDEGSSELVDVKESDVYMGEIPLMTERGTFIINGAERVVVSQLKRSEGVIFKEETQPSGRKTYIAQIIPLRGAWIEFESDVQNLLWVRLDRRKKRHATTFLRALGWTTNSDILRLFTVPEAVPLEEPVEVAVADGEAYLGRPIGKRIVDTETGELLADANVILGAELLAALRESKVTSFFVKGSARTDLSALVGRTVMVPIVDPSTGELLVDATTVLDDGHIAKIEQSDVAQIEVVPKAVEHWIEPLLDTIRKDPFKTQDEALMEVFRALQPGDSPTPDTARTRIERLYFDPNRYDLSRVGRYKLNKKLGMTVDPNERILRKEDIVAVLRYLLDVMVGKGIVDDIDHLGNRRVRAVGELLQSQVRVGLLRMARNIRERMTINAQELENKTPNDLINPKPLTSSIKDFFGSSQLSQFMAQTNPLDELTHKRRLSALGPGGLHRDRATYDVRDVHHTHYGRVCPIETPEGPSVGLIVSLSSYARVNEYGFLETPYQKVKDGRIVPGAVDYLSADQEDLHIIAQANVLHDADGVLLDKAIITRYRGDFPISSPKDIAYLDVSPKQVVSISAALIPFLEHDDANRALMGANQQRQAVPLLRRQAPVVGTGIEYKAALDSGAVVVAKRDGVVERVSADEIIIRTQEGELSAEGEHSFTEMGYDVYRLIKYKRSNSNTAIDQRPVVYKGQFVRAGEVIADGSATDRGELALGANVLVAFMSWEGYNYEDAIVVSERLVRDDVLTSIHIEEFELEARDTKLGKEEITRDIPNKSEEALKDLDEEGIVRVGSVVEPWDILVGKVTPKGESELGPEEKLLRAIFGDKAGDFKDASLEARPGVEGVVIDTRVFARKEREKDRQSELREQAQIKQVEKDARDKIALIQQGAREQVKRLLVGKRLVNELAGADGPIAARNETLTPALIDAAPNLDDVHVTDLDTMERIRQIRALAKRRIEEVEREKGERLEKISKGDELKPGVLKLVKVYIATKRKISVGDKLSGRHGNKGVISKILPIEDMPYLEDGTPIDMILNPLGVPGRMNVGQILETHLGWAATKRGFKVATPVFDGATEEEIREELADAGLPQSGKTTLYDGRTGEPFHQKVTVGTHYILKLNHLVADKIHARSIGPYSLVTQQPLGGKAQLGGQRFGEMEVWALEAYGAAYLLQELLTIKSDDVSGRTRVYESIVKGENTPEPGTPESFNVLIKELQSLCLDVLLEESSESEVERELLESLDDDGKELGSAAAGV